MNDIAKFYECPVQYIGERHGDVKHIVQDAKPAFDVLGWRAKIPLADGMKDFFLDK
jgi:nucleoside-diphosphate-sugar epimerase